ncbi:MAG: M24 family metallopeptidase [Bacilli bacterium]|nr:M24 family metallopeptidase [Bacilli bacterium]MCH4211035.1 M24 family metallopeptidase [Bacilli bacterium]MCH4228860.1 M24 family metallopeptidase [Bacilli bacterium]MCH4278340.1 M24 family metallopeptidase [Bacilli bacterium]MCI2055382.1 M24 family metallopeptidase [Bacilli bacterium]
MEKIEQVQQELEIEKADAWIMVDYENRNKTLVSFLGDKMLTRKIFMVFPHGEKPYLICHSIDTVFLSDEETLKNFDLHVYHTWEEMLNLEKNDFKGYKKVLMDISENGLLPRISLADYGSVEYIKSLGMEVISSGDMLQKFSAVYSSRAHELQLKADKLTLMIKDEAFKKIKQRILESGEVSEYEIQKFICDRFHEEGMVYDDPAIVAIGSNANNPHYGPTENCSSVIKMNDLVLIDMWAKMDDPEGVYADITWMGFVGENVPEIYAERFQVLKTAIDLDVEFLKRELPKRRVEGWEVDQVSRDYIASKGYGNYFIHRTGHNIAVDVSPHGPGVNIDNYESHDQREIVDGVTFSLEPGIYAPDFGERSETNVYIENRQPVVVAGRQEKIIAIMAL